jgi:hypothetical protein
VVIGAGTTSLVFAALNFFSTGGVLLIKPEVGAFEVDADARPFFTPADRGPPRGDARRYRSAERTYSGGRGTGAWVLQITCAYPYPAASYPEISAGNAAAVRLA